MNLNKKALGAAVAVALISTSAVAVAPFGNNTQRGSLLIFPRIEVTAFSDTLITMINDFGYGQPLDLKCYYLAPGDSYSSKKYVKDFTKKPTSNQPFFWWASTGKTVGFGATGGTRVIPVGFSPFPPLGGGTGTVAKTAGEMKCWAVNGDGLPIHFNHLSGTATIVYSGGQAAEYNAWAFEAVEGGRTTTNTGNTLTQPADPTLLLGSAELALDGKMYDSCPVQLLGSYFPGGANRTQITIAGCNQDLRQDRQIFETKLNYTFWDADENAVTGWYECADSWYERALTGVNGIDGANMDSPIAYFRVYGAPSNVCTGTTQNAGLLGVKLEWSAPVAGSIAQQPQRLRGSNLIGRGEYTGGWIKYDTGWVSPPVPPPN
jgi:hypothetical protein